MNGGSALPDNAGLVAAQAVGCGLVDRRGSTVMGRLESGRMVQLVSSLLTAEALVVEQVKDYAEGSPRGGPPRAQPSAELMPGSATKSCVSDGARATSSSMRALSRRWK